MIDDFLSKDAAIAAELVTTWGPFFGRFGRLREVQRQGIPQVLSGRDLLLVAPTASGKTEAACAPLVERNFLRRRWTILYISPTRALVNDLFERLVGPLHELGVTVRRRTGDHRDPIDEANVILTTPESFDSMLCRGRRPDIGHVLGYVSAVVLDEIHLLHGTARGEQLRWLLERLRRLRDQMRSDGLVQRGDVQVVALSATVPDTTRVADAYLAPDREVVVVGGGRSIEVVAPNAGSPTVEESLPAYLSEREVPEKVLVFSNNRKRVDFLARELSETLEVLRYNVRAHHGSLAQPEREATEAAVKRESRIVVCATMTLEIGIDIGDIDLVVLDGPAPNVPSLLQRIGRGNRRTSETRLMMCAGSLAEGLIHAAMLEAASRGDLGVSEHGPQYAVARQQTASYIFQAPELARPRPQAEQLAATVLPELNYAVLLDHLIGSDELSEDPSGIRLGQFWQDKTTKGEIHSTIEDAGGYQVVDAKTGSQIGKGIRSQQGRGMGVAGKLLEVQRWDDFRIIVRKAASQEAAAGEWSYVTQAWMRGAGQPNALRTYLGIAADEWPALGMDGMLCVFHFGGSRRKAVLQLALDLAGQTAIQLDDWGIWLPADGFSPTQAPGWLGSWQPSQLEVLLGPDRLAKLERLLARPRANRALPASLRIEEVVGWLNLEAEHDALAGARWGPPRDADVSQALRTIAGSLRRSH
jgi:ATP-dependent Lhr-like helicase